MQVLQFSPQVQAKLVTRAKAGDAPAFARIYDQTFEHIYRYALSLTRSREDAEDLTAETFERALRGIQRYESGEIPILVWLFRIARNVARERSARYLRQPTVNVPDDELDRLPDPPSDPDTTPAWDELLCGLTPCQRDVITLRLAGLRGREIAEALGKAEGTVKALQFAAIRNMRRAAGV